MLYVRKYIFGNIMHKNQPYYVKTNNLLSQKRVSTMIYYLFPRLCLQVNTRCQVYYSNKCPNVGYSFSLCHYLNELLGVVKKCPQWDQLCIQTHPYTKLNLIAKVKIPDVCYELIELYYLMNFTWETFARISSKPYIVLASM